jgi:hypothetical protein
MAQPAPRTHSVSITFPHRQACSRGARPGNRCVAWRSGERSASMALDVFFPKASQEHCTLQTGEPSAGTVSSSVHEGNFPHKDA